jgi:transporter family protein
MISLHFRNNFLKGLFYSLAGTIFVSTNFVTAKYGLKGFNPETFSLVWTSAAAIYALIVIFIAGHIRQLVIPASIIKKTLLMGLAAGVGMTLGWAGLSRLDPSFVTFLLRFSLVLTIVFGVLFLGERLLRKELLPIIVMILGGFISSVGRWHIVGIGMTFILLAGGAVAMQRLIAKILISNKIHPNVIVFYRVGIGALFIAIWTFSIGKADFNVERSYWLVTLLGAFLGPCVGYLLIFRSYRYWDLSRSSVVLIIQPIFVLPLAYLFFGKLPAGKELFGGFFILAGALWLAWVHFMRKTKNN